MTDASNAPTLPDDEPAPDSVPPVPCRPVQSIAATLKAGIRAALFMRGEIPSAHSNWNHLVGVTLAALLLQMAIEMARVGMGGQFYPDGLPGSLFSVPLFLFVAWYASISANAPDRIVPLALLFSVVRLPLLVIEQLNDWAGLDNLSPASGVTMHGVLTYWLVAACVVALVRELPARSWRAALSVLVCGIVLLEAHTGVYLREALWAVPYDSASQDEWQRKRTALANEGALYAQPALLDKALAAVGLGSQAGIELYFIGAAGYAEQDVFKKEVDFAAALFERRFGTQGRSIKLVNNMATAMTYPIASVTSLERSLKHVGGVMDRERDILFLFLTSHGSRDHKFALEFGEFRFLDLDPATLREILDRSGIRNRVIVISACYAGGFVKALSNDDTLVIAAAAPDKTSFGCSSEADFTYFGQAYFEDALSRTDSFIDAFELARPKIAARERKDKFASSDPQMAVGARIRALLEVFQRQRTLAGGGGN